MSWSELPSTAAWRHRSAREGFEILRVHRRAAGVELAGHTTAVEGDVVWSVEYRVVVDDAWRTESAVVRTMDREVTVVRGEGGWTVDGEPVAGFEDCVDLDLETSVVTNTLPIHRLPMRVGEPVVAPAVFVRADLTVERLEQTYTRLDEVAFAYACPTFDVACTLVYDGSGLIADYPGLAARRR